jgi:hypothetical protein
MLNWAVAVNPPPAPTGDPGGWGACGPGRGVALTPPKSSSKSSAGFDPGCCETGTFADGGIGNDGEDPGIDPPPPPDIGLLKNCVNSPGPDLPPAPAGGAAGAPVPPPDWNICVNSPAIG